MEMELRQELLVAVASHLLIGVRWMCLIFVLDEKKRKTTDGGSGTADKLSQLAFRDICRQIIRIQISSLTWEGAYSVFFLGRDCKNLLVGNSSCILISHTIFDHWKIFYKQEKAKGRARQGKAMQILGSRAASGSLQKSSYLPTYTTSFSVMLVHSLLICTWIYLHYKYISIFVILYSYTRQDKTSQHVYINYERPNHQSTNKAQGLH
jgi:hypothetical protein